MTTILERFNVLVPYFMNFMHCIKITHNDDKFICTPQLIVNSGGISRIIIIIITVIITIFDSNMY